MEKCNDMEEGGDKGDRAGQEKNREAEIGSEATLLLFFLLILLIYSYYVVQKPPLF